MERKSILRSVFIFLVVQLFFCNLSFASKADYDKGWVEFTKNNRVEARKCFEQALLDNATKADAYLSLCLLDYSEGKNESAFDHIQKFYENSTDPYPYLYAFMTQPFMSNGGGYLDARRLKFFEGIVADPKMNGTLRTVIYEKLGEYYEYVNNFKKSKEYFDKMGTFKNWQVLGTFDNTSSSGFNKDWSAISNATTNDAFKSKVGAEVKWYTPGANRNNNWFYLDYYFSLDGTIVYAQTFVDSPIDQEAYVRVGTSGSLKTWINDALVLSVVEERNCDLDIYSQKIKLNKGANRVLVQVGQSEISKSNFLLRITDAEGNPIAGLKDQASYVAYTKSKETGEASLLPFFAEQYFETKVKEQPENIINYIALAQTYLKNDKAHEGTDITKDAEKLAPKFTLIHDLLQEAYARARNQTDYTREVENIKINDPESFFALQQFYNDAVEAQKYSEAKDICEKVKKLYGQTLTTENWDVQLASYEKRMDDLISMSRSMYKKYPYDSEFMTINYNIENNIFKNKKAATSIVEDYSKKYFDSDALETLSKIYFEQGNTDKGLKVLDQRIAAMPYATGFLYNKASMFYKMQRYKDALAVTNDLMTLAPYSGSVYSVRGYIYKEMKETALAKENFQRSILYSPTSYDSRKQLRLIENKKDVFDYFSKYNLDSLIAKSPKQLDFPESNSAILLYDNQLFFYPEGAKEYKYEIAVKILNQSGIEQWKEYDIGYYRNQELILDKYEIIKSNGQKVKAETDGNGLVVFTNLEVGDILHLDYRIEDYSTGPLSKHFFDQFSFKYSLPSLVNRYCIMMPEDKDFNHVVTNGKVDPQITKVDNMKLYQWTAINQKAVIGEPYMSQYIDAIPALTFSSIPDWAFVSDWYRDLTSNKFQMDYVLKETYNDILKDKGNLSQFAKAELFYEYILKNITYSNVSFMQGNFIPQKASRTIITRLGDCKDMSTLFVALCREAGIKANLVLISTRDNGLNLLKLPTVSFNHCIAQLDVDGKVYYIELTDNKLPFGAALDVDMNSNILPIPYGDEVGGNKLLTMAMDFRTPNVGERITIAKIEGKDMRLSLKNVRVGSLASYMRQSYCDVGADEQLKSLNQSVASGSSLPTKVSNLSFVNLDNLADTVIYTYDIDIKNAIQEVAKMQIFRIPWTDNITSLEDITDDKREFPFELWVYMRGDGLSEDIEITLPAGRKLAEVPQNVKVECVNAVYEITYDIQKSGVLKAKRSIKRKTEMVSPEQYEEFKNFMHQVVENDNRQYAIN